MISLNVTCDVSKLNVAVGLPTIIMFNPVFFSS